METPTSSTPPVGGELELDLRELRALRAVATRPRVQRVLAAELAAVEREMAAAAPTPTEAAVAPPIPASTPTPTPTVTTPASAPTFTAIESWGWEQTKEFVDVLCLTGLTGVGALPPTAITCDFTPTSFDLKIVGLGGKNLRLRVTNLEKDIVPKSSRVEVKKNRVVLHLKKAGEWDHWMELVAKRPRKAAGGGGGGGSDGAPGGLGGKEDPSAALMTMMKDMYEEGDDATRKVIAEAWMKSREQQAKGAGKGGRGGLGGLDDDFAGGAWDA